MPKLASSTYNNGSLIKVENTIHKDILDQLLKIEIKDWIDVIFEGRALWVNEKDTTPRKSVYSTQTLRRIQTTAVDARTSTNG
jgi:hypothetical protein